MSAGANPVSYSDSSVSIVQTTTVNELVATFTSQLTGTGGTTGGTSSGNAPQTVEATDSGGALFAVISPGAGTGGTGGTGTGTPGGAPGGTRGAGTGGAPPGDSSDRALSVVANPPPVQGASQPTPRPPQTTTQLAQGLSQMVTGGAPPAGAGVPGIRGGFSSSGNPGRW